MKSFHKVYFLKTKKRMQRASLRLVDISKLSLNSKIKKFSYSFILRKGLFPPRGENSFLSKV